MPGAASHGASLRAPRYPLGVKRIRASGLLLLLLTILTRASAVQAGPFAAELVASGLDDPVFATSPPGDARLFIVELGGAIQILSTGAVLGTPFLDIGGSVTTAGEGGLLGLSFPPGYDVSGSFYVYYTATNGDSVLSRFQVSGDPDVADAASETELLRIPQPASNHNGGHIAFGPDGFLMLGLGDGGGQFDPDERAQDPLDLLGKMVRIDPGFPFAPGSKRVRGAYYAIPADNPWAGTDGVRDEIWAFGVRNPYRFSFDRSNGDLWIGDVGQDRWEEIDHEPYAGRGGRNWGWDAKEGEECVRFDRPRRPRCNDPGLSDPIYQYENEGAPGSCSVTGGYVYRGSAVPAAQGLYVFGDFCSGRVWALDPSDASVQEWTDDLGGAGGAPFRLVGFGEDGDGELHIVLRNGQVADTGQVYKLVPPPP